MKIVIIGGMGPQASLALHQRIIQLATQAGASDGEQYPEILHLSLPVPDFISDTSRTQAALDMITHSLAGVRLWPA